MSKMVVSPLRFSDIMRRELKKRGMGNYSKYIEPIENLKRSTASRRVKFQPLSRGY